ncbi:MAG: glycerate kinase [Desulfovibrio sp.]|jgi:glycerate kinase|nr:glycerate kinase [Desulfovibrio sp.]
MRVLIAPDSFKGSLSASEAAKAMERGVLSVFPDAFCDLLPIADGGEGTVEAMAEAAEGKIYHLRARGPLGSPVEADWALLGDGKTAVVEMAAASGLTLLARQERDPLRACTSGTGETIKAALQLLHSRLDRKKPRLIIGIGGSATNDGGAGCMRALGARFLDADGKDLPPGGAALAELSSIDLSGLDPLLFATEILVACDVDNPLCGPRGASAVFGPQKGATPDMVQQLDAALVHYAAVARAATGLDVAEVPGAGAAGGLGAGLLFFTGAKLRPGIEIVMESTGFAGRAAAADLVLTGEGSSDVQTAYGKAPVGIAGAAKKSGKPVICISGALGSGVEAVYTQGIDSLEAGVCAVTSLDYCMENAAVLLEEATRRVCRTLRVGMGLGSSC